MKRFVRIGLILGAAMLLGFAGCTVNVNNPEPITPTSYAVSVSTGIENGSVSTDRQTAQKGQTVTLTLSANAGYQFDSISVKDASNNSVETATVTAGTKYTFVMPESDVTVNVSFTPLTLTSISVSGTPVFAASNVFFAGDSCDRYSLSATATYSDSSTKDVSASTRGPESVRNTPGSIVFSYTEGGVTKTFELAGSFYIAASDALTQTPVVLENYSGTLSGGTYYKFGDFPQTVSAISGYSPDTVYNGWYLGSNGYFYAKIKENAFQSGYKYSNGTDVAQNSANSYKYFKVEPIKWRVLTDNYSGKRLLLAENILVNHRYAASSNNYANSEIRAYLNDTFWNTAFTDSEKAMIDETDVDNSAASTTDVGGNLTQATSYACGTTKDKIFLLSEKEATTIGYGFTAYNVYGTGNSRIRMTTDFAKASGALQSTTAGYGGWWWLRSPSCNNSNYARYVSTGGGASYRNDPSVSDTDGGVCPALSLKN